MSSERGVQPRVTGLTTYPLKGGAGQPATTVEVEERGLAWDRRWMLVDEEGTFLSQRQLPALATIAAQVSGDGGELRLSHLHADNGAPRSSEIVVPVASPRSAPRRRVRIWRDELGAVVCPPEAGRWASEILGRPCELVFMPEDVRRPVNPRFARSAEIVSFADAYPVLLIGEGSLVDLNARLGEAGGAVAAVPMNRFRPNVVVSTVEPFAEDGWGELEIGAAVRLCGVKACGRCAVPTVDQQTGERRGPEPIRTLAHYRRLGGDGVFFGQNLLVLRPGRVTLGDPVRVVSRIPAVYQP